MGRKSNKSRVSHNLSVRQRKHNLRVRGLVNINNDTNHNHSIHNISTHNAPVFNKMVTNHPHLRNLNSYRKSKRSPPLKRSFTFKSFTGGFDFKDLIKSLK